MNKYICLCILRRSRFVYVQVLCCLIIYAVVTVYVCVVVYARFYCCLLQCMCAWSLAYMLGFMNLLHMHVCVYISYMCIYMVVPLCKYFRLCVHVGSYTCVVMLELVYVFVSA